MKFPNVGELNIITNEAFNEEIFDKFEDIENEDLQDKYEKSMLMLEDEKIKVRYFIKNEKPINFLNRCFFLCHRKVSQGISHHLSHHNSKSSIIS